MASKDLKEELLKILGSDMRDLVKESKKDLFEDVIPEKKVKMTLMADSKPELLKALKEAPKLLSKSEQIMKAKLGIDPEEKKEEKECSECEKSPCECD